MVLQCSKGPSIGLKTVKKLIIFQNSESITWKLFLEASISIVNSNVMTITSKDIREGFIEAIKDSRG